LVTLVRHHLLLADTASRRDLDDPATARFVASALGDEITLDLLAALTVADSTATGSAAWSSMKARLVDTLVERTRLALSGQEATVTATAADALVSEARASGLAVRRDEHWYSIATADRPGLLAAITASLAIEGVDIRSADLHAEEELAVDRFYCEPGPRGWPEPGVVAERIRRGLASPEDLFNDLERRVAAYPLKRQSSQTLHVQVAVVPGASDRATVIELIAPDRRGLFAMVAKTVADLAYDVRAARLSTVGDVAIDTLYVREHDGPLSPLAVADLLDALEQRVTEFSGLQH
jgi:[protein-PII] uridylyltransferase